VGGSTIGGVIGAAIGGYFGGGQGAQWGWMIGSAVGGYIDPEQVYGPRLDDANETTAQDGIPIPFGWGTFPCHGNVIWRDRLYEHEESSRGGKGGSTENITYRYTRSYAIGICEGPITGILIVKLNGKIVYDARTDEALTAAGYTADDIAQSRAAMTKWLQNVTFYLGTETQTADPTIEAVEGVGNVEHYLGLAYMVVEDDDLTDFRGAIPQYEFVVTKEGDTTPYTPSVLTPVGFWPLDDVNTGIARDTSGNGYHGEYYGDVENAEAILPGSIGSLRINSNEGGMRVTTNFNSALQVNNDGVFCIEATIYPESTSGGGSKRIIASCLTSNLIGGTNNWTVHLDNDSGLELIGGYSDNGGVGRHAQSPDPITPNFDRVHILLCKNATGMFVYANNVLVASRVDAYGTTTVPPDAGPIGSNGCDRLWVGAPINNPTYYNAYAYIGRVENLGVYDVFPTEDQRTTIYNARWLNGVAIPDAPGWYIDELGNILAQVGTVDLVAPTLPTVGEIVADVFERSGLTSDQYDVSQLTDTVTGFRVASESTGEAIIAPLMQAYFFDVVEFDGKVRCIKRGGDPVFALTKDDLVARSGAAFEQERVQEAELLRRVTVDYLDPAATYTATTQKWERRSGIVRAKGEASVQIPIVCPADDAAQIAEKRGKVAWAEPTKHKFSLGPKHNALTPTDVGTYTDDDGVVHRIRLMKRSEEDHVLLMESAQDSPSAYESSAVGAPTTPPIVIPPPVIGPTSLAIMNLPVLAEAHDEVGLYVAARGQFTGWNGCVVQFRQEDATEWTDMVSITQPGNIGTLDVAVPADVSSEYPGTTTFEVTLPRAPESISEEALLRYGNRAFLQLDSGQWEVFQFETVTANGDDSYTLDGVVRGRYATTPGAATAGNQVVLYDSAVLFVPAERWMIGETFDVRAVANGTSADMAAVESFEFDPCVSQTEWPVHNVTAERDGSDNVTVNWIGRARLGSETAPFHSQYFTGYRVTFDDGVTPVSFDVGISTTTYTLASAADPIGVTVAPLNSITGEGPASDEISV